WHAGRLLRRLDDGHGAHRAAPGAQGGLAPGFAGRHVPRRRLPPQRRLPAQLWARVRRTDGVDQGHEVLRLRPARYLRVVPGTRAALRRELRVLPRQAADVERLRPPPELRSILAAAGGRRVPDAAQGPDAERRRLVGPGGLLRPPEDLRDLGEAGLRASQHDRRRALESWRLERRTRRPSRPNQIRGADGLAVSREDPAPILR